MAAAAIYRIPELSLRFSHVWRRNLLVWKRLALASVLGNIADPLLYGGDPRGDRRLRVRGVLRSAGAHAAAVVEVKPVLRAGA